MGRRVTLSAARVAAFRRAVRGFYRREGRHDMPWRLTRDPYRIFVSEVMLQQTQVARVRAFYPRFIRRFPSFRALARSPLSAVLRAWQGLGYNRRAMFLKRAAQAIVKGHGGTLPRDPEILAALPGIGPGTAGSLAAFAYDLPVPFIETNIRRVFLREFFPRREKVNDREILPLIASTLDRKRPREWCYALMDYGASLGHAAKKEANPNRRSAHYKRQAAFEGSDRQVRGGILKALLAGPVAASRLRAACGVPAPRLGRVLAALRVEGFVRREKGRWRLCG